MTFDWSDYVDLAEELASRDSEAAQRAAVSRAYYGVFCLWRNWLFSHGFTFSSGRHVHRELWNEMNDQRQTSLWTGLPAARRLQIRQTGNQGHRLLRFRQKVDYEDDISDVLNDVPEEIERARQIQRALDA